MWNVYENVLLKQLPKQLEKRCFRSCDNGKALIVGFSGAPGSGKTTLVKSIKEELLQEGFDVCVVREVARDIFERWKGKDKGFRSLEEIRCSDRALEFQLEVLREQVTREDRAAEKHEVVLIDRTVYDNLFYALFYPGTLKSLHWFDEYIETFERACTRRYDVIFLCETLDCSDEYRNEHEHGCECGHGHGHEYRYGYGYERECGCELDDGFRISDEYRKLQQYAIEKLIPESTPVCPVPPADVDERVQFCLEVLHELRNELGREEVRKWC